MVADTPKMMLLGRDWQPFLDTLITEAKRQQAVDDAITKSNQPQEGDTTNINPVLTRKGKAAEKSQEIQNDKETEESDAGATDLFIHQMDPMLDVETRVTRQHL